MLELDNCPLITDNSLDHLVSCYNLRRIELYDCQLITKTGIRRLRVRICILINKYFKSFNILFLLPTVSSSELKSTCLFCTGHTATIDHTQTTILSLLYYLMMFQISIDNSICCTSQQQQRKFSFNYYSWSLKKMILLI